MLLQYAAERLHPGPLLAATSVVAGAATFLAGWRGIDRLAVDLSLAFALTVQFRAWDDICDRDHDAVRHPTRITVRTSSLAPLAGAAVLVGTLCMAALVLRDNSDMSIATLVVLWLSFAAWYCRRGPRTAWSDHLLVAKYPAFVVVIAGTGLSATFGVIALTLAVVYLAFCVYEAWHDVSAPWRLARIAIEAPLLGSAVFALGAFTGGAS